MQMQKAMGGVSDLGWGQRASLKSSQRNLEITSGVRWQIGFPRQKAPWVHDRSLQDSTPLVKLLWTSDG